MLFLLKTDHVHFISNNYSHDWIPYSYFSLTVTFEELQLPDITEIGHVA